MTEPELSVTNQNGTILEKSLNNLQIKNDEQKVKPNGKQNKKKGGSGGHRVETPTVQLSKALAYILRHGTEKEKLKVRSDGFVDLNQILQRPKVSKIILENGNSPKIEDIRQIVDNNDKKRFEMKEFEGEWFIRAVQGHSLEKVTELNHIQINLQNLHLLSDETKEHPLGEDTLPPGIEILHGTTKEAWQKIQQTGGLNKMKRNHIHLAKGRPGSSNVISGMRSSSAIILHIDLIKALQKGDIPFFLASNGAVLTSGQGSSGVLPLEFISKAEEGKTGNVIWTNGS